MKKLLYCLGVTKGGTTWLHWSLSRHPGVSRIPRKEIHYFLRQYGGIDRLTDANRVSHFVSAISRTKLASPETDDLGRNLVTDINQYGSPWDEAMARAWAEGGPSLDRYRGMIPMIDWYKTYLKGPIDDDWYLRQFDTVPDNHWCLDFSTTSYLCNDAGFARMRSMADDTRAVILLRDPVDRLWSHVKFHAEVTHHLQHLPNWYADEIRTFVDRHNLASGSYYADAVQSLMTHFPEDRRMIINFEDLRSRPDALFADVQTFLGLDPMELPQRNNEGPHIAASQPIPLPKGAFAHLAGTFQADLERLSDMGLDFVRPWILNAEAHGNERPETRPEPPEPRVRTGLGILARKLLNGPR